MNREDASSRSPMLDALRGIAVLSVVLYHFYGEVYRCNVSWRGLWPDLSAVVSPSQAWAFLLERGSSGVALFFVLSGYCIHASYLRRPEAFSAKMFYWRRWWRIYPPYIAAMLLMYLVDNWSGWDAFLTHICFVHNFHRSTFYGISPAFWSLPVEFQLYLLYPLLLLGPAGQRANRILVIPLVSTLLCQVAATPLFERAFPSLLFAYSPFAMWFFWALGAWVAERHHVGERAFPSCVYLLPPLGMLFLSSVFFAPLLPFKWWIDSLFYSVVLDVLVNRESRVGCPRVLRPLVFVGIVSYSMYLLHQPLLNKLIGLSLTPLSLPLTPLHCFAIALPVTVIVLTLISMFFHRSIEQVCIETGRRRPSEWISQAFAGMRSMARR